MNTVTTLPVGYRPQRRKIFSVSCPQKSCRVDVHADGNVVVFSETGSGHLSLDQISFPID